MSKVDESKSQLANAAAAFGFGIDSITRIKLKGGIIGRLSMVVIVALVAIGVVAWSSKNPWVAGGALVLIGVCLLGVVPLIVWYAHRHPGTALMEGAELLLREHMQYAMKSGEVHGASALPSTDPSRPAPVLLPESDDSDSDSDSPTDVVPIQ